MHASYPPLLSLLICARCYTITPLAALCLTNHLSLTCCNSSLNLVKDRLVTWLLQSGMDHLLISDFHPVLTPSTHCLKTPFQVAHQHPYHAAHLVTAGWHLLFSIITDFVIIINVCVIILVIITRKLSRREWNLATHNRIVHNFTK